MYSVRNLLRLRQLCPSSRVQSNAPHKARTILSSRRCVHSLPDWPYNIDDGLGEFLSPAALRMLAVDYQQGLLTRLDEQVKGTEMENQTVTQTVISAAGHRRHALAFNYASQALNNSFFLHYLRPPQPPPDNNEDYMDDSFMGDIRLNFGTLSQLKSTFSAAAMGMINSGWVWLVSDENGGMQVVGTFGAGTLLVRSRRHMLDDETKPILGEARSSVYKRPFTSTVAPALSTTPHHAPPATSPSSGLQKPVPGLSPSTPSRELHASSLMQQYSRPNIFDRSSSSSPETTPTPSSTSSDKVGDILTPLLCVSVYEHAWVGGGYGIWGKEEYLKRFWTVVNWQAVAQAYYHKASRYK